jgi:peroxiredoxin
MSIKKIITTLSFTFFFTYITQAQNAIDFTLTSTDGRTFNLYEQLDSGKIVILDFFSVGCPSCQQNTPHLDSIWQAYGYNGDSLWVWGIESYNADSAQIESFRQQYSASFPCFSTKNDTEVLDSYNITYTPQYYITCPINHTAKKISFENIESYIENCKEELYTSSNITSNPKPKFLIFQSENAINIINQEKEALYLQVIKINGQSVFFDKIIPFETKKYNLSKGLYLIQIKYTSKYSQTFKIAIL